MANTFDTSFIPQQPLLRVEGASQRAVTMNLPLMLSLILFFVALMLAGGVTFFKQQADKLVMEKQAALVASEKNFNIDEINELKKLEVRLDTAKRLVDQHAIFSAVFDLIQSRTAQNIGLTALEYSPKDKGLEVSLSAEAPSYEAAYFQLQSWRETKSGVISVEGSNFRLDEKFSTVSFDVAITLDPKYIQATQVLEDAKKAASEEQIPTDAALDDTIITTTP